MTLLDADTSLLNAEKLFYERFQALHNDKTLLSVFRKYGIAAFRRSAVLEGFAKFVEANGFRGGRCVEIGTCTEVGRQVPSAGMARVDVKSRSSGRCF